MVGSLQDGTLKSMAQLQTSQQPPSREVWIRSQETVYRRSPLISKEEHFTISKKTVLQTLHSNYPEEE